MGMGISLRVDRWYAARWAGLGYNPELLERRGQSLLKIEITSRCFDGAFRYECRRKTKVSSQTLVEVLSSYQSY